MNRNLRLTPRIACLLYESVIISGVLLVAALLFHALPFAYGARYARTIFQIYLFAILGIYFCAFWTKSGQTIAMKTWRLRLTLTNQTSRNLSLTKACVRYVLAWCSFLLLGFGFFWALFDSKGQYLHDKLLRTEIRRDPDAA